MRATKIPDYIQIRSSIYYVRIAIPPDLRPIFGKNELKKSLNTRSRTEAAKLAPSVIAAFQQQIETAKAQCTPVHTTITQAPIEDARRVAQRRLEQMQVLPDRSRASGNQFLDGRGGSRRGRRLEESRELLEFLEDVERGDQWDSWRIALGRSTVQAYEDERGVEVERHSNAHGLLSELGAQVQFEHLRRAIHRDEQPYSCSPAPNSSPAFAQAAGGGLSLAKLIDAYRADKKQMWRPSSANAFVKIERVLFDWFGREVLASSITREQWRELFNLLPRIPTRYAQVKAFKGMTLRQVVSAADAMTEQPVRLSAKSCGDYVIHVNSLLNWATKEDILPKNPAKGLSAPRSARSSERRKPFSIADLNTLFTSGPYAHDYPAPTPTGAYWLPLVALFTGMRSGEIACLKVSDIAVVDGISCFRLTDLQALKTEQSARDVPVHSELRRLGFLDFVEAQAAAGKVSLFADIRRNGKDDQSSEFSKVFRKMLRAAGLSDPAMTMHSFRHTFAHALVAIGTPQAVAEALQGWGGSKPRNMFAHYGGRPPIQQLADTVDRVTYPGLDLRHLYKCSIRDTTTSPRRQFD